MEMSMQCMGVGIIVIIVVIAYRRHCQRMNPKEVQSRAMIRPAAQVHASASTKIQKESYSFHEQPYFKTPSWLKMTVAVSRT
jgi:hypothetical protein